MWARFLKVCDEIEVSQRECLIQSSSNNDFIKRVFRSTVLQKFYEEPETTMLKMIIDMRVMIEQN